jgi:hypothetical protein
MSRRNTRGTSTSNISTLRYNSELHTPRTIAKLYRAVYCLLSTLNRQCGCGQVDTIDNE